jgi:hypothetical protein
MNIYKINFVRACPNNDLKISYQLRIETPHVLMVEAIVDEVGNLDEKGFHEAYADTLTRCLPGRQILTAHHHGVDIETVRGSA